MTDNVAPLVPPTPGEAEEIMRLAQGLDAVLQESTSGSTAMSAIASIVVNLTAHCPPGAGREEIVADLRFMLLMLEAMGDKTGEDALAAAQAVEPDQCWTGLGPLAH